MKKALRALLVVFLLMGIGVAIPISTLLPSNGSFLLKAEAKKKKKKKKKSKKKKSSTKSVNIAPISLSGTGNVATQLFTLQKGVSIFESSYTGDGYFGVWLKDANGNDIDLVANSAGSYSGKKAVGVSKSGSYFLNVEADSNWSITITQPRPTSGIQKPTTLTGKGNSVTQFLYFKKKGLARFNLSHDGADYFGVWLLDSNGNEVDLLANGIGAFNGSKGVRIPKKGVYLINVEADGNWSISVN